MKQLKYFMFVAAVALAIVGCRKPVEVSFDKETQEIDAQGGSIELALKSNGEWAIALTEGWIMVSPMSGSGDATILLTVAPNKTSASRSAEIKATTKDNTATMTLTQNASQDPDPDPEPDPDPDPDPEPQYYINVDPQAIQCSEEGGEFTVEVSSNIEWEVTTPQWVTSSMTSGANDATLTLTISPIEGELSVSREGEVVISGLDSISAKVIVVQKVLPVPGIELVPKILNYVSAGDTKTVTVATVDDWVAAIGADWVTLNHTAGHGETEISVTVGENPLYVERQTTVVFTTIGGVQAMLSVRQEASVDPHFLEVSPLEFQFDKNGGEQEISVGCDTDWAFELNCDWLSLSQPSGTGNATVILSAEPNPYTESRAFVFHIKSGELNAELTVTQAPGDEPLYADFEMDTLFVSANGGIQHVQLNSNTTWQLQATEWISLLTNSGEGNVSCGFVVDINSGHDVRVGYLNVVHNGQELGTLVIVQEGWVDILETDITQLDVHPEGGEFEIQVSSNQSWTVNLDVNWMRCEPMSGFGNKTLILKVDAMSSAHPRTGHIKLSGSTGMVVIVTVDQH